MSSMPGFMKRNIDAFMFRNSSQYWLITLILALFYIIFKILQKIYKKPEK